MFYAGASRTNLTPPIGIAHAGWGVQTHSRAAGVDMDLYGTVLVVGSDDRVAAFIDVDYCMLDAPLAAAIRSAAASLSGIDYEAIRVTATHTHSGPMLGPSWLHDGDEMVPAYVASIPDRLAGAVWQARRSLRPARLAAGSGSCDIGVNRRLRLESGRVVCGRNWGGPVDRQVEVVRIDDLDERPIATIANFACHPTIMGPPNQLVTPDYPGVTRKVVEDALGGLCIFVQGAAGNIHAVVDYSGDTTVYRRLGSILGHEVAKVALGLRTVRTREQLVEVAKSSAPLGIYADTPLPDAEVPVAVGTRRVELPIRDYGPIADLEARYGTLLAAVDRLRASAVDKPGLVSAIGEMKRARMRLDSARRNKGKRSVEAELHGIRIGDVAFVAFPGEPFCEIGLEVKSRSPFAHTIVGGYTNGYIGYVPTDKAFAEGGYEPDLGTPLRVGAARQVSDGFLALLDDLRGTGERESQEVTAAL